MRNNKRSKWVYILILQIFCFCLAITGCSNKTNSTNPAEIKQDEASVKEEVNVVTQFPNQVSEAETQKENKKTDYVSVVDISINPYFRAYLDSNQNVVNLESLNEDAENVCMNLDITDKSFDDIFGEILTEAANQGYLNNGKKVEVLVLENAAEVYAPDITQHTTEIAEETFTNFGLTAEVAVAISKEIVEEQSDFWNEDDKYTYVENAPVLDYISSPDGIPENPSEPEICLTCNGSGIVACDVCDGHGELACAECDATGIRNIICDRCTNGLILCDTCNGNYDSIPCDTCGGDGLLEGKCPYCKGTGICISCGGSGVEKMEDGNTGSCHTCNGDGLHTNLFWGQTRACHGAMPCNSCPGTGYQTCHNCYHLEDDTYSTHPGYKECDCEDGYITEECPACEAGTAVCGNCDGKGTTDCPDCK